MTGTNLAKESLENEKAISYYNTKFVFFNNIDTDYKKTELIEDKKDNDVNIEIKEISINNDEEKNNN
jgi:hypothetical protein